MANRNVGNYLKQKRQDKGLTQSDVALKMGYGSPQFISNIERGISQVPIKALRSLIEIYGISPEEIVEVLIQEKRELILKQLSAK